MKLPNKQIGEEFLFGVEGMWVVSPSRHGAHNWQGIGGNTARASVLALKMLMKRFIDLPQIVENGGTILYPISGTFEPKK